MKFGIDTIMVVIVIINMALVPIGSADTKNLGNLYTDGNNDIANADSKTTGTVYVPQGYNTFTVDWKNVNDGIYDGQGAKYVLTVWDVDGNEHTTTKNIDQTGEGTISVSFNSLGSGDAQYTLYCDTHTYFGIDAKDQAGVPYKEPVATNFLYFPYLV